MHPASLHDVVPQGGPFPVCSDATAYDKIKFQSTLGSSEKHWIEGRVCQLEDASKVHMCTSEAAKRESHISKYLCTPRD